MFYCHPPYSQGHTASQRERNDLHLCFIGWTCRNKLSTLHKCRLRKCDERMSGRRMKVMCVCVWAGYRSTSRILFSFFLSPREKIKKERRGRGGGSRRQTQLRLSIECALSSSCNHDAQFSFALTDRQFSEEASSRQYYLTTLSQKSINLYSFILFEIYFFELRDFSSIYLFFPLF
jgi:hypothetical protein